MGSQVLHVVGHSVGNRVKLSAGCQSALLGVSQQFALCLSKIEDFHAVGVTMVVGTPDAPLDMASPPGVIPAHNPRAALGGLAIAQRQTALDHEPIGLRARLETSPRFAGTKIGVPTYSGHAPSCSRPGEPRATHGNLMGISPTGLRWDILRLRLPVFPVFSAIYEICWHVLARAF